MRRLVRERLPELELLAFQTFHGPKMDEGLGYPVTFQARYIRLLSVRDELVRPGMGRVFLDQVLPQVIDKVRWWREASFDWPSVIVAVNGGFYAVSCSEGGLFPNRSEILKSIRAGAALVSRYD